MRNYLALLIFVLVVSACDENVDSINPISSLEIIQTHKFKTEFEHNAFTDIIHFKEKLFVCHRASDKHVFGENGKIIVHQSTDSGASWKQIACFEQNGVDLRDPKFVLNEQGILYLYIHGSVYQNRELLGFLDYRYTWNESTNNWGPKEKVSLNNSETYNEGWPWRINWDQDTAYVFGYGSNLFDLYFSLDGLNFSKANLNIDLEELPNEVTIRLHNGSYYALGRVGSGDAVLLTSNNPLNKWELVDYIPWVNIGGPDFLFYEHNNMIIGGRMWSDDKQEQFLTLANYDLQTKSFRLLIDLPGKRDLGYPGLNIIDQNLVVSYYATLESTTNVFFVELNLN
ncbi:hypothetical protein [Reichenbachiella sp.]|uniref:hypothetical protein n=1 Tax=Reichenbachiella sp. TaxID=2184521 RepID=UPI003BAF0D4B